MWALDPGRSRYSAGSLTSYWSALIDGHCLVDATPSGVVCEDPRGTLDHVHPVYFNGNVCINNAIGVPGSLPDFVRLPVHHSFRNSASLLLSPCLTTEIAVPTVQWTARAVLGATTITKALTMDLEATFLQPVAGGTVETTTTRGTDSVMNTVHRTKAEQL